MQATKRDAVSRFAPLLVASVSFGALAWACTDTADSLNGWSGDNGSGSSGAGGPPDDGGLADSPLILADGSNAPALALAEKLFNDLLPDLKTTCGSAACHGGPNTSAPLWLAAPEYDSIKKYDASQTGDKKFIVTDVLSSRLFTKGVHTGPAMPQPDGTGNLGDKVKHWLDIEAAALQGAKLPTTTPLAITQGANSIDISTLGTGIAGAKITFNATITGSLLALDTVKLVAPAASGVHVVHPIFVQVPADTKVAPILDPADQGSNVDDTAGAGKTITVGTGTYLLTGFKWQATDQLAMQFAKVESGTVTTGDAGGSTGCKNVAGFQNIAGLFKGAVVTPNCTAACHKTGGGGDGALDLNGLVLATPDYAAACAQALNVVNLQNKAQSPLILHPTGQMGNHAGGTVSNVTTFTNMVMTWLNGE
jgi:hypothetical protein